jgi:hypothetical protein
MDKRGKRSAKGKSAREAQNPTPKSPGKAIRAGFRSRIPGLGKRIPPVSPNIYQMRARAGILWTRIRLNSLFIEKTSVPGEIKLMPGRKRTPKSISGSKRAMVNSF